MAVAIAVKHPVPITLNTKPLVPNHSVNVVTTPTSASGLKFSVSSEVSDGGRQRPSSASPARRKELLCKRALRVHLSENVKGDLEKIITLL